jgi:hypothetical protein
VIKIKLLVQNVPMGRSFDGLAQIAKAMKCDPEKLSEHEVVMFLNTAKDKMKILGRTGSDKSFVEVIGYIRAPRGLTLSLDAIQYLPQTFHDKGRFDYDAALKMALTKALVAHRKKGERISPLEAYRASKVA